MDWRHFFKWPYFTNIIRNIRLNVPQLLTNHATTSSHVCFIHLGYRLHCDGWVQKCHSNQTEASNPAQSLGLLVNWPMSQLSLRYLIHACQTITYSAVFATILISWSSFQWNKPYLKFVSLKKWEWMAPILPTCWVHLPAWHGHGLSLFLLAETLNWVLEF